MSQARDQIRYPPLEASLPIDRRFLEQIAITMPDMLYVYDLVEERNVYVNREVTTILGYSPEEVQAMGTTLMANLLHPDDQSAILQRRSWFAPAHDGEVLAHEVRMRHVSGHWRWLAIRETVFARDENGTPTHVLGIAQDITERKHTEEAYHNLVEHSLQGLVIMQEGRNVFVNPASASITGYTQAELLAMSSHEISAIVHPDDQAMVMQRGHDRLAGKTVPSHYEFRIIRQDGEIRWLETFATHIEHRGRPAVQLTFLDVTERKQYEAELRKLQRAVEQSASSIIITDHVGHIEYVNPHFTHLTGYTLADVQGHTPRLLKSGLTPPAIYQELWTAIMSGHEWRGEFCNRKKDGELYWEHASISPIYDAGRITHFVAVKEDITERKHMEEALRERESLLRGVFAHTPSTLYIKDLQGRYLYMSTRGAKLLHLELADILGNTDNDIFPPNIAVAWKHTDEEVLTTGKTLEFETYVPLEDGMHTFIAIKFPIYDAVGEICAIGGGALDITARKRAEEDLRLSEERYRTLNADLEQRVEERTAALSRSEARSRALLDAMPDSMFLFQSDGTFLDFRTNDSAILYISPAQIIGSNLYMVMPPHVGELLRPKIDQLFATGSIQVFDYHLELPTGTHDFEARLVQCGTDQILAIVRDITRRKRNERVLQESEARYRTLVEASPDAILLTNLDSTIRFCNQQAADLFSYATPNELMGQKCLSLVAPDRGALSEVYTLFEVCAIGNGTATRMVTAMLQRKDGRPFPAELHSATLISGQGEPAALTIVVHDITERTTMQARMIANERFVTSGRLVASVAHEINTPLQALQNFLDLIQIAPESERERFLEHARYEVQRVGRIVGQLLDLYRPRATAPGAVEIHALIERILLLLGKRLKEQKVKLECELAEQPVFAWGRADEVTQVLLNVLVNALDAMPYGGVLSIQCWEKPRQIHIAISDTGSGIDPAWLNHIFEPFVTTKQYGTGLGLSISRQIIEQNRGQIQVSSTVGEGSTFTIMLPSAHGVS